MTNFLISFVAEQPLISIIAFSLLITWVMTWLYKKLTNQERIHELKKKQKEIQARAKQEKDPQKMLEIQKEMLEISSEMMRISMKPMIISMLPIIAFFTLLRWIYTAAGVGNIIPWSFHIAGLCDWKATAGLCNGAGWFLSYIIFSLVFSPILRKMMKVE